jgi:hypothetical protein
MAQKKCNHCGVYKDEEEFNWRSNSLEQRNKTCRVVSIEATDFTSKQFG